MSGKKPDTVISNNSNATIDGKSSTIIELLRHGELEGGDTFRGSTDDVLTNNGWQQMVAVTENKNEWDIIVTSPLSSCREFAEVIAQEEEIDLEINEQFVEIDFGLWEDQSPNEILKEDSDLLNAWWQSPTTVTPPEGEDFHDFRARILKAFKELKQEYQGKRILIVTHSGVIRIILMHVLGMQDESLFRLNVDYASFSKIQIDNNKTGESGILIEHH